MIPPRITAANPKDWQRSKLNAIVPDGLNDLESSGSAISLVATNIAVMSEKLSDQLTPKLRAASR
jgi:hypothetical protein